MNKFAESTLRKYEKYLKVKNYSDRTIDLMVKILYNIALQVVIN